MSHIQPDTTLPKTKRIRIYAGFIAQTGTGAPTVTVLQNDLGEDITWSRTGIGTYVGTTTSPLFTTAKTYCQITTSGYNNTYRTLSRATNTTVEINTGQTTTPLDDILIGNAFEIRIYE